MFQQLKNRWALVFGAGLGLGLLIGVGMLVGALAATNQRSHFASAFAEMKLHGTSTHGGDSFAMATGPVGDGMEGVFFLDFLTGDLRGCVLNSRTGGMGAIFKTNVAADLAVEKGKKPSFLMTTGVVNFRTGGNFGGKKPADCVVYVCDTHTGMFAAYSIPYNIQIANNGGVQGDVFVRLGTGKAREISEP